MKLTIEVDGMAEARALHGSLEVESDWHYQRGWPKRGALLQDIADQVRDNILGLEIEERRAAERGDENE